MQKKYSYNYALEDSTIVNEKLLLAVNQIISTKLAISYRISTSSGV